MAFHPTKTLPSTVDIPSDLATFKNKEQAVWTGSSWRAKSAFTPSHGDTVAYPHTLSRNVARQDSMYLPQQSTGLKITTSSSSVNSSNYELYGDGRWMPASCFNGLGFEVYQSEGGFSNLYLQRYALLFAHKTEGNYRFWGVDTGARAASQGFRYIRIPSTSSTVNEIRTWGPSFLLQGILLHFFNNSGGSGGSYIEAYNLKVGHKGSTTGNGYRCIPPAARPYTNRDKTSSFVSFSNPFTPK